jgi:hypothetical protein
MVIVILAVAVVILREVSDKGTEAAVELTVFIW